MTFGFALFIFVILLQSVAQILEKYGMMQMGQITNTGQLFSIPTILKIVTNPYIIGGVALSAMGLFLWLGVLSNLKVSYIYPFGAISYILLAVLAHFILKESITPIHGVGICVIVLGCYLINK